MKKDIVVFYKNQITLEKIRNAVFPDMKNNENFVNTIFEPFNTDKNNFKSFLAVFPVGDGHLSEFMKGNYYNNARKNKKSLRNEWADLLCNGTAFSEMLHIITKLLKNHVLNAEHIIFKYVKLDIDNMPENFVNFLNLCFEEYDYSRALLILILWSIYGEHIIYINSIFSNVRKASIEVFKKSVRLMPHEKACRSVFMGRDEVIEELHEYFSTADTENKFVFLKGMGGIGKSECAKQYAKKYKENYEAIIFAEFTDTIVNLVNNNNIFTLTEPFISEHIRNVNGLLENDFEFYQRKLMQMKTLKNNNILIIIDNLDKLDMEIDILIKLPFDFIITTRWDYSEIYPDNIKKLGRIKDEVVLKKIFSEYCGKNVMDNISVNKIIDMFDGHTMAIELVAKQIKSACMTPEEMLDILQRGAEDKFEEEFIMPNHSDKYQTFPQHMLTLFNVSALNDEEKYIMMCLALMPLSGIDKRSFKHAGGLKNFNSINKLIESSWISESCDKIYLHTLIKETVIISCKPDLIKCYDFIRGLTMEFPTIQCWHAKVYQKNEIKTIVENIYNMFPIEYVTSKLYDFYEWTEIMFNHFNNNSLSLKISYKLLKIYRDNFGENHFRTAKRLARIACAEKDFDNIDTAEKLFVKSRKIILELKNRSEYETLYLSDIDLVLSCMILESRDLSNNKDLLNEVKKLSEEAIYIRKQFPFYKKIDPLSLNCASLYRNLAWIEIYNNDYEKVHFYFNKIVEECERLSCKHDYFLKEHLETILFYKDDDLYNAVNHMKNVINKVTEYSGKQNIRTIYMNIELGDMYMQLGDTTSAYAQYRDVLEHLERMTYKNKKLHAEIIEKIKSTEIK